MSGATNRRRVLRAGVAALALVVLGVVLLPSFARRNDEPRGANVTRGGAAYAGEPTLVGRPPTPSASKRQEVAPQPTPTRDASGSDGEFAKMTDVRLLLVRGDGSEEGVAIDHIGVLDPRPPFLPELDAPTHVSVTPGIVLHVYTHDARAFDDCVSVTVPDPVPETMVVRIPARDDPRLAQVRLEIVDSETGAPLPEAKLDWMDPDAPVATQSADDQGYIVVRSPSPSPGEPVVPALSFLVAAGASVHASGYEPVVLFNDRGHGTGFARSACRRGAALSDVGPLRATDMQASLATGTLAGVSRDGRQALIFCERAPRFRGLRGYFLLMESRDGEWRVVDEKMHWVS